VTQTQEDNSNNIIIYVVTFYQHGSGDRQDLQKVYGVRNGFFIHSIISTIFFLYNIIILLEVGNSGSRAYVHTGGDDDGGRREGGRSGI